jgi:hypothetical protein
MPDPDLQPPASSLQPPSDTLLNRIRYVMRWSLVAATLAAGLSFAVNVGLQVVKPWIFGFKPWWVSVAAFRFLGPHSLAGWLIAGVPVAVGIALAAALGYGGRRWLRIAGGTVGGLGLVLLALAIVDLLRFDVRLDGPFPWDVLTGLGATALAGTLVAFGMLGNPPTRRAWRWAPLPTAALLTVGFGLPTLLDAWEWYGAQDLRPFTAELVCARRAYDAEIISPDADVVEANGAPYLLDHRDTLRFTVDDVGRVLWFPAADGARASVGIRLRLGLDGDLARRSARGVSSHGSWDSDALFVDGRLFLVAAYRGLLLDGRASISADETDDDLRELYRLLTGSDP